MVGCTRTVNGTQNGIFDPLVSPVGKLKVRQVCKVFAHFGVEFEICIDSGYGSKHPFEVPTQLAIDVLFDLFTNPLFEGTCCIPIGFTIIPLCMGSRFATQIDFEVTAALDLSPFGLWVEGKTMVVVSIVFESQNESSFFLRVGKHLVRLALNCEGEIGEKIR